MSSDPSKIEPAVEPLPEKAAQPAQSEHHSLKTAIGAVSGGIVGAVIGRGIGGKGGGAIGAVAGAIAGGLMGEIAADDLIALEQQAAEALGEASGENELPAHYTREQLQALSKPALQELPCKAPTSSVGMSQNLVGE